LMQAASIDLPYERVNPITLAPPIAPHLAAERAGVRIDHLKLAADILAEDQAELKLVEGAGGWRVPLGDEAMTADLARALGGEVILVVGMRLGCINHALLSAGAIEVDGCRLAGWIANLIEPNMDGLDGNLAAIARRIGPPLAHYRIDSGWSQSQGLRQLLD
jgi:dethiobiotin synthetase